MTRILNGCAEARTVGTHYSTTHPPPLSQNSTSSYRSFSFSFSPPSASTSVPRVSLSLFLSPSHPGPPCPHFSRWLVLQTRTTFGPPPDPSLSLSLSAPRAPRRSCIRTYCTRACRSCVLVTRIHIYARARAHGTHSCSILFSFHLSFYPTPFLRRSLFLSLCLSPPLLLLLRRFSAKRNPRM